jgi:hypothetical protein
MPGSSQVHNLSITAALNSGAFNILDVMRRTYTWVFSHWANAPLKPLAARWTRGLVSPTSYRASENRLRLSGSTADPDEFDDTVIAHEFMHYVYDELVGSLPAVSHSGSTRVAPGVAFTEGLATALGQQALGTSVYIDKTQNNTHVAKTPIESNATAIFANTSDGTQTGDLSEYLVAMLVWDLFDPANEAHDKISAEQATADTILQHLKQRSSRAAPGLDLVDLLDGWRCAVNGAQSGGFAIDSNLTPLLQERSFTYDLTPTPACP